MPTYYLYFVGPTGRIMGREDIAAEDDPQAIALADRKSDGRAMELWQGSRQVKLFAPRSRPA